MKMKKDPTKLDKPIECILCGKTVTDIWDANNPEPLASYEEGQCCKHCDQTKVIPARIEMAIANRQMN